MLMLILFGPKYAHARQAHDWINSMRKANVVLFFSRSTVNGHLACSVCVNMFEHHTRMCVRIVLWINFINCMLINRYYTPHQSVLSVSLSILPIIFLNKLILICELPRSLYRHFSNAIKWTVSEVEGIRYLFIRNNKFIFLVSYLFRSS